MLLVIFIIKVDTKPYLGSEPFKVIDATGKFYAKGIEDIVEPHKKLDKLGLGKVVQVVDAGK